jgi:hypothetical protein
MIVAAELTSLTKPSDAPATPADEEIVAVDEAELRQLHEVLQLAADSSPAAGRLAQVISAALDGDKELVLMLGVDPSHRQSLHARLEALVEQMMPQVDLLSEASAVLSQRNSQARTELLSEFGALTGEQIAEERSQAKNRHALAARWRKEGRLFGVPYNGQTVYPAFQFDDDDALRPVIAEVLQSLPTDRMSPWETALWWTSSNGWLHGRRPVDLLDDDPRAVATAAARLAAPSPL